MYEASIESIRGRGEGGGRGCHHEDGAACSVQDLTEGQEGIGPIALRERPPHWDPSKNNIKMTKILNIHC